MAHFINCSPSKSLVRRSALPRTSILVAFAFGATLLMNGCNQFVFNDVEFAKFTPILSISAPTELQVLKPITLNVTGLNLAPQSTQSVVLTDIDKANKVVLVRFSTYGGKTSELKQLSSFSPPVTLTAEYRPTQPGTYSFTFDNTSLFGSEYASYVNKPGGPASGSITVVVSG